MHTSSVNIRWTISETTLHGIDLLALVAVTSHSVNVAVFLDNKVE